MTDIVLPKAIKSEEAVLGSMMIEPDTIPIVSQHLEPEDFYKEESRKIYSTILEAYNKCEGTDSIIIAEKSKINMDRLMEIIDSVLIANEVAPHIKKIKTTAKKRNIITSCSRAITTASTNSPIEEAIAHIEKAIMQGEDGIGYDTPKDLAPKVIEMVEGISQKDERILGIRTGWRRIDQIIDGLKKGEVTFISGATKAGKTTFALNLIENLSVKRKLRGLVLSYEMKNEYLLYRMILNRAGVQASAVKRNTLTDGDWKNLVEAGNTLADKPIYLFDIMKKGGEDILRKGRMIKRLHGLDYIVIDHLHLINSNDKRKGRTEEVGAISKQMKEYAKILDVPIISLAQLNRDFEKRDDKKPVYSDLRNSGEIEHVAGLVLLLHCPGIYDHREDPNRVQLIVDLNRFGPAGMEVDMYFDRERMRYKEVKKEQLW